MLWSGDACSVVWMEFTMHVPIDRVTSLYRETSINCINLLLGRLNRVLDTCPSMYILTVVLLLTWSAVSRFLWQTIFICAKCGIIEFLLIFSKSHKALWPRDVVVTPCWRLCDVATSHRRQCDVFDLVSPLECSELIRSHLLNGQIRISPTVMSCPQMFSS